MGVVAAPHEFVQPDPVAGFDVVRLGLAHTHPHVLLEVLGGVTGQHLVLAVPDLADGSCVAHASDEDVEPLQQRRHPGTAGLGDHHPQARKALEHARQDHLPHQRALCVKQPTSLI